MTFQNDGQDSSNALTVFGGDDISQILFSKTKIGRRDLPKVVRLYHACDMLRRQLSLSMFEREAHVAAGVTWETFCAEYLDIAEGKYAYELIEWARVERAVLGVSESAAADSFKIKLPRSTARLLGKLPDAEQQKTAYGELKAIQDQAVATPKDAAKELVKIVNRMLGKSEVPIVAETVPAIEPPRVKPDMTPIVPPTYDRGPEHDEEPIPEAPKDPEPEPQQPYAPPVLPAVADPSPAKVVTPEPIPAVSESALLIAAVKLLRQFRYAVKTANQDLIYEADAGTGKFLKEYEDAEL